MRAVVQRVTAGAVSLVGASPATPGGAGAGAPGGVETRRIGPGLVVLVGVGRDDDEHDARFLAGKIVNLRIFEDDAGKMNRSLLETGGSMLAVSQFTLYGDASRGRRPSFIAAAEPSKARALFDRFVAEVRGLGVTVETGWFQESMHVEIHNDGPVTILLDSDRTS
ncbi:MAG TPA: D-aminoacyl-tRNA deacylase [Bacillota bacterium]